MSLDRDLAKGDIELLKEIGRQAEVYLDAQLQAGIAADQRAMSFVSLLAAATVVVAGAGVALLIQEKPNPKLGWTCLSTTVGFTLAMLLAILSARPCGFWYGGSRPADWQRDLRFAHDQRESYGEHLMNYEERIGKNAKTLEKNSRLMNAAVWLTWASLVLGGLRAAQGLVYVQ